jgi:hypothetical protein
LASVLRILGAAPYSTQGEETLLLKPSQLINLNLVITAVPEVDQSAIAPGSLEVYKSKDESL